MYKGEECWAQLVSITDIESSPIPIVKSKFLIGRNSDCDLSFAGNKLVSGSHCYIERDDVKVWLCDTSTNGTLLNMKTKVAKGKRHELLHGDEIHIVYKKNAEEENIGYLFQDKKKLDEENEIEEMTQDYDYQELDQTLSDEAINQLDNDSGCDNTEPKQGVKRKVGDEKEEESAKKKKIDPDTVTAKKATSPAVDQTEASTSKAGGGGVGDGGAGSDDDMFVTLSCIICQEILHDCISLQPCMHSFCAGCYSEWMEKSNQCPSCRMTVDRINKNHLVNNLVEAYLKTHPGLKRTESDLEELDQKNKITRDMLYPKDRRASGIEENSPSVSGDDDEDDDGVHDDDDESDDDVNVNNPLPGIFAGFGTPFFGTQALRPNNPVCRQCPNYATRGGILPARTVGNPDDDDEDEDAKTFPTAPDYRCRPNENHVLCLCCLQPMPDRRRDYTDGGTLPPQQCSLCYRSFCHAYWGCQLANCSGCLGKLKDLNFGKKCLTSVVLDNAYESSVLKDYLASQDMSVKNLLAECLAKMVAGEYTCINQQKLTYGINTPVCYACGLHMFKQLAYQYRKDIPDTELPGEVTRRPNCYWGSNCRTQRNKPEHAQRFNHICDQTRTA